MLIIIVIQYSQASEYRSLKEAIQGMQTSEKCSLSYAWKSQKAVMSCQSVAGERKQFVFSHLTRDFLYDGMPGRLKYELQVHRKGYSIHHEDWSHILSLLGVPQEHRGSESVAASSIDILIIDAGHGGNDQGTAGQYAGQSILEKDLTLIFARAVAEAVKSQLPSLQIKLTRDSDRYVSLERRVKTQLEKQKTKAAVFISFHMNHSSAKSVRGIELYTFGGVATDQQAQRIEALENKPWLSVIESTKEGSYKLDESSSMDDLDRKILAKKSRLMAIQLEQELDALPKLKMRGIKEGNFVVLSQVLVPSLLVEVGYISNEAELNQLMNIEYQQRFAKAVANMIRRFVTQEMKERL